MGTWQSDLIEAARDSEPSSSRSNMSEMKHTQEFSSRCCVHSEMTRQRQSSPSPALPTAPHIRTRGLRIFLFFILPWGCFLVEVKGWGIDEITEIVAGTIFRRTGGREEAKNPWNQAQDAAGQLQAATRRVLKHRNLAEKRCPTSIGSLPSQASLVPLGSSEDTATQSIVVRSCLPKTSWMPTCSEHVYLDISRQKHRIAYLSLESNSTVFVKL